MKKPEMEIQDQIIIYKTEDGQTQIDVRVDTKTVWLPQTQITELFQQTKQNISLHINNIFKEKELDKKATIKEYLTVQKEGNRRVSRKITHYNLDVIISVGYRVKSKKGTQFRIWANKVFREYLVQGFAVNEKRLSQKVEQLDELKKIVALQEKVISG